MLHSIKSEQQSFPATNIFFQDSSDHIFNLIMEYECTSWNWEIDKLQ